MELDINEDEFPHHLTTLYKRPTPICLETRLFYVRIAPCAAVDKLPDHLVLHHPRRDPGTCLEINGSPIPASESVSITLRRDRVDRDSSEVTYVATDSVRLSGGPCEFEVCDGELDLILCGSLQNWGNLEIDSSRGGGWSMDCYVGSNVVGGKSAVFGGRVCSPSIEVYVAGRCSGEPVILSKTVLVSPRRKVTRQGMLDAIPEDEEVGKKGMESGGCGGVMVVRQRKLQQFMEANMGDYESDGKVIPNYYSEDYMYQDEDGQLSWFNAGVRVGVGIGLGMCVGVGIGVGLLMRSYQATTRSFRRKFF